MTEVITNSVSFGGIIFVKEFESTDGATLRRFYQGSHRHHL
jgi:hypothetical protein